MFSEPDARVLLGMLPETHAAITEQDTWVLLGVSLTLRYYQTAGGSLTFSGVLGRTISRDVGGNLPFAGVLGRYIRREAGGNLTFVGTVNSILTFVKAMGGNLTFDGILGRFVYRDAGGNLTFTSGLGRTISRDVGGSLTSIGVLGRMTQRGLGGLITFIGTLGTALTFVSSVGGNLTLFGSLQAQNPDWLLIPDYLNWTGLWSGATTYAEGDAVLFVDGTLHHAFASKAGSNLNHSPNDIDWWYRINQEPWGKV